MKRQSSLISESVLIERLNQHDQQAFQWLYDQYSPALYGVVLRIVRDEDQAQDLLQDIFVKIWKNLESYDATKGRLFTWMLNVSRNTAIDALRSRKTQPSNEIRTDEDSVHIVDRQHNTEQPNPDHIGLQDVVKQLRPDRKELIDLVYFGGYTHEEAAEELNLPLGTVKTRIRAALHELKQLFKS
ncbi:RNA polymerase sigma factor [Spirosoma sp. KUDC1026]|uniref:RNA polymerase sigma factor n=1 Tax=Spirosoma sp. KUDC1026 TaxID=2745947 RepID=UPI00159B867D|nr:sigma-70 family RNA polymerase sigma factor [Spirosoma sp. KUDC1026]QKZ12521.1 sigma-70 family RNA polymerase sigma factor [Spirosoma sp. KUDC1026]